MWNIFLGLINSAVDFKNKFSIINTCRKVFIQSVFCILTTVYWENDVCYNVSTYGSSSLLFYYVIAWFMLHKTGTNFVELVMPVFAKFEEFDCIGFAIRGQAFLKHFKWFISSKGVRNP